MSELVQVSTSEAGVTCIALNRPEKRNALNIPMLTALCDAVDTASGDEAVRVIVLRGNGPVFCAGLDLKEAGDPELAHESAQLVSRALQALYDAPKPTIAAVHGAAIAGGAGLMSCCDLAIATMDSKFGYPEVHRGLVAGLVMTFLWRQVSERFARELLLTGEIIGAERAEAADLINRAVPTEMLEDTVEAYCDKLLKGSPQAIATSKAFFDQLHQRPVPEDLQAALDLHVAIRTSEDAQEGMRAFVEKRPPRWEG